MRIPRKGEAVSAMSTSTGTRTATGRFITPVAIVCHMPRPPRPRGSGSRHASTRGPSTASSAGRKVSPYRTESATTIEPARPIDERKVPW